MSKARHPGFDYALAAMWLGNVLIQTKEPHPILDRLCIIVGAFYLAVAIRKTLQRRKQTK